VSRQVSGTSVFAALAAPTRRAILDALREGECPAGALQAAAGAGLTQPAFSQHLAVLRRAGLVSVRQEGRRRLYRAEPEPIREAADWFTDWVAEYDRHWDEAFGRLADHLDRKHAAKPRSKTRREGAA